jgi:DNA polymerase III sliding clamp (beta) subunit (PCNA family)
MTKVVFETATIQDALKKAEKVAPSRGEAFDKAAGIKLTIMADTDQVLVQATNLEVFYSEWIGTLSIALPDDAREVEWRVPARTVAALVGSFPIGSGQEVVFEQPAQGRTLKISSGRTRGSFQLIDVSMYPEWDIFDPDDLTEVEDFTARLAQVEWACSDDAESSFNGVNLTGDWAQACDRYRAARVPLKIDADTAWPFASDVTVPTRVLTQIMRATGTVMLGCTPTELLVMPNEGVQVRARLFGQEYLSLERITGQTYDHMIVCRKAGLLEILNRAMLAAGADRFPSMQVYVGKSEIAAMMSDGNEGMIGDILPTPGYAQHDRVILTFTPRNLIDAIDKCPSDQLTFSYDPGNPLKIVKVDDGAGYEAWVMARKAKQTEGEA